MIYVTPEKAKEVGDKRSLSELKVLVKKDEKCDCGRPAWKFAGLGMCFQCTTGESDNSNDYELKE